MKRLHWICASVICTSFVPTDVTAVPPRHHVAPSIPPGEVGDDDQPDKNGPGADPGFMKTPNRVPEPTRDTAPRKSPKKSFELSAVRIWLSNLFERHPSPLP